MIATGDDQHVLGILGPLIHGLGRLPRDVGVGMTVDEQHRRALEAFDQLSANPLAGDGHHTGAVRAKQHARAGRAEDTDWRQIAMLYDVLAEAAPGPIVEVNRAVAHGRAFGPGAGLRVLDVLDANALGDSPLAPSVRGDLLERAGLHSEAAAAFTEAARRTRNEGERMVLQRRAEENLARVSKAD